jgi:iron complex outermembrane receptor protein
MNHIKNIIIKLIKQLTLIIVVLLFSGISVFAQEAGKITVRGVIMDNIDQPLIGATIIIKGTTNGTTSDLNGKFSIEVPKDSTLIISFIGYLTEEIKISNQTDIRVIMVPDISKLDEVVIVAVGYGTMRKADLTGAIASVSSDDLKKGVISSAEQVLQGKVAGLTVVQGTGDPSSGASLRLRGGTSLSASNGPLIVVDGIPGVDFNTVQPSEIVSVDVLKDASAAAIYGSRGANGVIIVTTNRSNKGKMAEYNSYVAIGQVANHLDLLSANQWRKYVRDKNIASAVDYGANTDWQKEIEQTSLSHSHTLSFSNNSENGGFRIALSYLSNNGIIKNSHLDRLGASLTAHHFTLNNKLKLEAGIYSNFDKWNPVNYIIFERAYNLNPTVPVKDENGDFTEIGGTNTENPVEINENRYNDNTRHRLLGFGKAELELLRGLKGVVNLSYEYNSAQSRYYLPTYAYLGGIADKGYAQKTLGDYRTMQLETYLTYNTIIMRLHKVNLMGGYSFLDNTYEGFGAERRGFDTDLFLYNNLAAGQDFRTGDVYSYKGSARLISFFTRLNYNLKEKYLLTATLRDDGSSRFGANNKWGLFPSASVAWRISGEPFMNAFSSWLNNLKLRAGYGVTGNQDGIGEYKSLAILGAGTDSYYDAATGTWKQSYGPVQNPNPDLKWESTAQINIGIDFALLNRINGSIELYQKKTSDLLYTYAVPQPPYLVGTMLANVGDLSNKGIELTLNTNIIRKSLFSWDMNLTLAHNKQKIEKLSNQVYKADTIRTGSLHGIRGMSNQYAQLVIEGYPVGAFFGPKCSGIDSLGKFVMEDGGKVQYLGTVQPKLSFGWSTTFTYHQLDLNISTYGMIGQKVLNATAMSMSDPTRMPAQNVTDEFIQKGITSNPTYSSYWIEDASFLRLQSVTLGYNIKISKFGINHLRLYMTGENLFVITGYSGIDPEVSIDGLASPGIDRFNYFPKARTVLMGLNVSF